MFETLLVPSDPASVPGFYPGTFATFSVTPVAFFTLFFFFHPSLPTLISSELLQFGVRICCCAGSFLCSPLSFVVPFVIPLSLLPAILWPRFLFCLPLYRSTLFFPPCSPPDFDLPPTPLFCFSSRISHPCVSCPPRLVCPSSRRVCLRGGILAILHFSLSATSPFPFLFLSLPSFFPYLGI